ncbi:MAG TPA: substrate-binding domain-containing protein [Daejeonella sp.]|nr:substrate-binding domain-containing protein [Daejeonella sp.]
MKLKAFFSLLIFTSIFVSCRDKHPASVPTYTSGDVKILVDESLEPIIDDQILVFENNYPKAKIELVSKPENELLKLFLSDSIRVAILSRELKPEEAKFYENKKIVLRVNRFAIDGIALVTHQSNPDSTVTVADIIDLMKGKGSKIKSLVFDNPNSSTVRYFKELAGVTELPAQGVYALKSNSEVLNYVYEHPGSIGVVGINWIVQPEKDLEKQVEQLKVLGVKNLPGKKGSDGFYKPNQNDLALGLYPLTRNLYVINGEGGPGLGTGFASFLAGERGQRIVLKSGLLPDSIPPREIIIKTKKNE